MTEAALTEWLRTRRGIDSLGPTRRAALAAALLAEFSLTRIATIEVAPDESGDQSPDYRES